ncbi:MAG: FHA domain-containing protein [Phycisphaerales bacterium]
MHSNSSAEQILLELILRSRLRDMERLVSVSDAERRAMLHRVFAALRSGWYLVGAGPYTSRLIALGAEEVVIGRYASPTEEPAGDVIDYDVADAMYLHPVEVSRTHCAFRCLSADEGDCAAVKDRQSRLGTYHNGARLEPNGGWTMLSHGDVVSLGPSGISSYVVWKVQA